MDRIDWLVLCALTLPVERAFDEIMKPACVAEPEIVIHPSVTWWAIKHSSGLAAIAKRRKL